MSDTGHVGHDGGTPMPKPADTLVGSLGAIAAIAVAALLTPLRETAFGNTNAALVLVVVVAATASHGGRAAGAVSALIAALSYNFFLTRPYLSLHIDHTTDVVTVLLLVVVGLVVGEFARNRFRRDRQLRRTTAGSHRLERVARLMSDGMRGDELANAFAHEIAEELDAREVRWQPGSEPTGLPVIEPSGWIPSSIHHHQAEGFELPADGGELPVLFAGSQVGSMLLTPSPGVGVSIDERRVAVALVDLLGSAIGRNEGV